MRREPPRRVEPPPPSRRPDISRRLPPDRSYDRAEFQGARGPDGGGALRAFIVIAVLGGAALGGGLYFGGGMGDFGSRSSRQPERTADATPSTPLDTPSGVPLGDSENLDNTPPPSTPPERASAPVTPPREAAPPPAREQEQSRPAPQQVASNTQPNRPISLVPGSTSSGGSTPSATAPAPLAPPPSDIAPTDPGGSRPVAASVSWAQRPTARRITDHYPARALREGVGGRVQLDCVVQQALTVDCTIASESPAGEGFGRAAISVSAAYRARATLSDGTTAVGARTRIAVAFQAPQQ